MWQYAATPSVAPANHSRDPYTMDGCLMRTRLLNHIHDSDPENCPASAHYQKSSRLHKHQHYVQNKLNCMYVNNNLQNLSLS
jgi:hypothetical protein